MHKSANVGVLLIAFACLCSQMGCKQEEKAAESSGIQAVRVLPVQVREQQNGIRYSAVLQANVQIDLAFKSAGIVAMLAQKRDPAGFERSIGIGDVVRKGELLARVRSSEYEDKVEEATASLNQAEAQVTSAEAKEVQASRQFGRTDVLYQTGSTTQTMYDNDRADKVSASAAVAEAKASASQAKSSLNDAQIALHDTAVYAPFTGQVVERQINLGQLVSSSQTAFSLVDLHFVKADFAVPDTAVGLLHVGMPQQLQFDTQPLPVTGHVTGISPAAGQNRTFDVQITIPNPGQTLRSGMIGTLVLSPLNAAHRRSEAAPSQSAHLAVPLSAVVKGQENQAFSVFLIDHRGDRTYVHPQAVQIGPFEGDSLDVTQGLTSGQEVVTSGAALLHAGQEVRIIP